MLRIKIFARSSHEGVYLHLEQKEREIQSQEVTEDLRLGDVHSWFDHSGRMVKWNVTSLWKDEYQKTKTCPGSEAGTPKSDAERVRQSNQPINSEASSLTALLTPWHQRRVFRTFKRAETQSCKRLRPAGFLVFIPSH